jgi:hypothetical protein
MKCFETPCRIPILAAIATLCLLIVGCGGSDRGGNSAAQSSSAQGTTSPSANPEPSDSITGDYDGDDDHKGNSYDDADNDDMKPTDRDNDSDNKSGSYYDTDDNSVRDYGHAADAADRRTITTLVKHYFAAAASENGASACSMIVSIMAKAASENLGGSAGPVYARGNTCAVVLSKLFYHYHRQLAAHDAELKVTGVRVDHAKGIAVLGYETLPGRQLHVLREGNTWKVDAFLDLELP